MVHSGQIYDTKLCNKLNVYLLFFIVESLQADFLLISGIII